MTHKFRPWSRSSLLLRLNESASARCPPFGLSAIDSLEELGSVAVVAGVQAALNSVAEEVRAGQQLAALVAVDSFVEWLVVHFVGAPEHYCSLAD